MTRQVIVIGGPTASGKSALAVAVARAIGGIVVNADSMQLYRDLPILTARPSPQEEQQVPHRLYGLWSAGVQGSAGRWLALVEELLAQDDRRPLVLVGGTGLYLDALLNGMAAIPDIPAAVRAAVRAMAVPDLHATLMTEDPAAAAALRSTDPQRMMRALEVIRATGRSLMAWQSDPRPRTDLGSLPPLCLLLAPPRADLVARIRRRLEGMVAAGALDELRAFLAVPNHADSPLFKAVGVPELAAHLTGEAGLDESLDHAAIATRQYAKRQVTFFRHRLSQFQPLAAFGEDPGLQASVIAMVHAHAR